MTHDPHATTRLRRRSRPKPALPACRSVTIIPVHDGRLVILGPDREQRAIFASPITASVYVQCLMNRLEYKSRILRQHWEAEHVDHQDRSRNSPTIGDIDGSEGPQAAAAHDYPD